MEILNGVGHGEEDALYVVDWVWREECRKEERLLNSVPGDRVSGLQIDSRVLSASYAEFAERLSPKPSGDERQEYGTEVLIGRTI